MKARRVLHVRVAALALLVAATLVATDPPADAAAGQITPVVDFGSNPGNLLMFEWVPADLPPGAPVVVVLHGCFAGASLYDDETGWTMLAERWNVALVFPEQTAANDPTKCFRWWDAADNARGQGEALSIKQMVDRTHATHGTDPSRVFIMGHSGGGLFTSVMLATYPDVFRAGAIVAGGPYGCGDEGAIAVGLAAGKSPLRGGECVDGSVDKTPQEWGDLARSGHPAYAGQKPRVSIWHGTADTLVSPKNLAELVEQWTNYHGTDQAPDRTDVVNGYPHNVYDDAAGRSVVESYELTGQSHGWPYDPGTAENQCNGSAPSWNARICGAYYAGAWFGLDAPAVRDDSVAPTIDIRSPQDGGVYILGQSLHADYACSDDQSGVESCQGPVGSGGRIDTTAVGEHAFSVIASDHAGNVATVEHRYRVVYDTEAFLAPVDDPPAVNSADANRSLPLKWRLRDADGTPYTGLTADRVRFSWTRVDCGNRAPIGPSTEAVSSRQLSYDEEGDHYIWTARPPEGASGTCQRIELILDDGTLHVAEFAFR